MEIGPIFRALMHNKARFWLITVEVALTLAIVVNCVNLMLHERGRLLSPSGLDEGNLVELRGEPFVEDFKDRSFREMQQSVDLEKLRSLPGVRAATAISFTPLGGGGSLTALHPLDSELGDTPCPFFVLRDQALETLGVELSAGRSFEAGDWLPFLPRGEADHRVRNVILTEHLAQQLFPDGDALGKVLADDERPNYRVVGTIRRMHNAWPRSEIARSAMLVPGRVPGTERMMRYLVRVEEGAMDAVFPLLEPTLREAHPGRIFRVRTLADIKARTFDDVIVLIKVLGALIVILVAVTALGIVGLTSFSVTQRTREIGTRRALGATRAAILRYFLVENWIITGIGLLIGALLTVGLNLVLTQVAGAPKMDGALIIVGAVVLCLMGQLAAAAPALRATFVPPELATRSV
jgi:putative ABC transport system permease protein